ncbi:hypothetical protein [Halomonas lysinitropha]|uniref:DUF4214 domain-containing protein n=1 Tax=Halomonas lysinitropha TaxID=2607506 RepID=A0A5K1I5I3_9GAMM|nr:hypothetical protein [Halomonas lysinitropha]VVZ95283.1 hypothetical protein HALO32_01348 [Halomonas lysinitropha]
MIAETATAYHSDIQQLFVAYYGRPGDPGGVAFWARQALAKDGDLAEIVQAFGSYEEYIQSLGGWTRLGRSVPSSSSCSDVNRMPRRWPSMSATWRAAA